MSVTIENIGSVAAEGKNVVLTSPLGIGTVSKTFAKLEAAGLSIAHLYVPTNPIEEFGIFTFVGDTLRMMIPLEFLKAEVLVFDGMDGASEKTLESITEIVTEGTLHGIALPALKSVVTIFHNYDGDSVQISDLPNTVSINVR